MNQKLIGIIALIIGAVVLIINIGPVKEKMNLPVISQLPDIYLIIVGVALVAIGVFFLFQGKGSSQPVEIPIYEGEGRKRRIVGYRRHKK